MHIAQRLGELVQLFSKLRQCLLAKPLSLREELNEVRRVLRLSVLEDPVKSAESMRHAVQVLCENRPDSVVVEQPLDRRRERIGGGCFGRPANGHEEEREELEAVSRPCLLEKDMSARSSYLAMAEEAGLHLGILVLGFCPLANVVQLPHLPR